MRIGIKISPLSGLKAGIPNTILNLLTALADIDQDNQYFLYTNRPIPFPLNLPGSFTQRLVTFPSPALQLWYQIGLPIQLRRDRIDLFHDPVYPLPFFLTVPGMITVHDLSNLTRPAEHRIKAVLGGKFFPVYLKKARAIVAISHFTASDLIERFPYTADKITVIHLGVSEKFKPETDPVVLGNLRDKYNLPERFMLFLGTLEPRKNIKRILQAYEQAGPETSLPLVIAGGLGWKYQELVQMIKCHPMASRIHAIGFVEEEDLPSLLSSAEFLVFPSLHEGFGLPVIEAMACGTPVLTSNVSSLPEVAGDSAYLVDPLSVESIAKGMIMLATKPGLRLTLSEKGIERSKLFDWKMTAEKTLKVYHEVFQGRTRI